MSSENLHAPRKRLTAQTLTHHHAIVSLVEELEAVDWYRQRCDDCGDSALNEILRHNMREEIEHACMVLGWLRRNMPDWAKQMDKYLYTNAPITEIEISETDATGDESGKQPLEADQSNAGKSFPFTVGSLKNTGG